MKFSNILKELRIEQNLTQKQLADKLGFSKAIIGHWENGRNEPTAETLLTLSKFFDVSVDFLLGFENNYNYLNLPINKSSILTNEEKEILSYFNAMSVGQKAETRGFMRGLLVASGINIENLNKGI